MLHPVQSDKSWNSLSLEEKVDALHEDIGKLFSIAEEFSHKNHVFIDAINLVHGRLDSQAQAIRRAQSTAGRALAE